MFFFGLSSLLTPLATSLDRAGGAAAAAGALSGALSRAFMEAFYQCTERLLLTAVKSHFAEMSRELMDLITTRLWLKTHPQTCPP